MKSGFCPSGQLLREIRMSYARTKVWVWFKGGLDGGEWRDGFYATDNAEHANARTGRNSGCNFNNAKLFR